MEKSVAVTSSTIEELAAKNMELEKQDEALHRERKNADDVEINKEIHYPVDKRKISTLKNATLSIYINERIVSFH
ncbi:hypothetical protein ACQKMD_19440 [Viridibacillus sp. NPDC096237]|uniref:hypothetical protein n=1 Tax=Viridibacillus sp. NPDC096237 TaxID=3390721 RepID=UPI003D053F4C